MADTDFSQFNPSAVNAENDSAYQGDSTRSGGIAFDQVMSSLLGNKILYQASTMNRALALMMVDKGFSPKDGTSPYTADTSSNTAVTALKTVLDSIAVSGSDLFSSYTNTIATITNPNVTNVFGQTALLSAAPYSAIYKLRGGIFVSTAPSNSPGVAFYMGTSTPIVGGFPLTQVGDFCKISADMVVPVASPAPNTIIIYATLEGLSAGVQLRKTARFSGSWAAGAGLVTLVASVGINGGNGSGVFLGEYISFEGMPL